MKEHELYRSCDHGRCELIDGEIVRMSSAGFEHGWIAMRIARLLANHVQEHNLGIALAAETGFLIRRNPDTVRAPDAAFIAKARLPNPLPGRGFFPGAPDFAVEVVSPEDVPVDVTKKAREWLAAGARLVWIVDPKIRSITAHSASGVIQVSQKEVISADPVVAGFSIQVADVFSRS